VTTDSIDALVFSDRTGSYYIYAPGRDASADDVEGFLRDPAQISSSRVPPDRNAAIDELLTSADTYGYVMSDFPGADSGSAQDLEFRGQVTVGSDTLAELGLGGGSASASQR
jgi:hypothetical protein